MGQAPSSQKYSAKTSSDDIATEFADNATGKYAIITGANSGIGFECVRQFAKLGVKVVLACRSQKNGDEAVAKLRAELPEADVEFLPLDLSSLESINSFVEAYKATGRPLHILLNNAGVMACPFSQTKDGFESQFGVNHLGHFSLTMQLWDILVTSGTAEHPSRVVNVGSIANYWLAPHNDNAIPFDDIAYGTKSYDIWRRYGASKLANILFAQELNRRAQTQALPVIAMSLHPGFIADTNLMRHSDPWYFTHFVFSLMQNGTLGSLLAEPQKNVPQGAATSLYCCLAPDVVPGAYYVDCLVERRQVNPKASDQKYAQRLWDLSLDLLKAPAWLYEDTI